MPSDTPRSCTVPLAPQGTAPSTRLDSLDALRGFDMFWIIGGDAIGRSLRELNGGAPARLIGEQLNHVAWDGFHFYDLIFPLFIFVMGIAIVLSLTRTIETHGRHAALARVFRRSLLLYVLGLFYYGGLSTPLDQLRLMGVLQRLALCYFFTSLLFIYLKPRALVGTCIALLVGYWALMTFVPVPGVGAGDFAEGRNLANWIDREYLPLRKLDGDHDPLGLLSTLPAIASCLLGIFAAFLLRDARTTPREKVRWLVVAGVVLIAAGYLWGFQFPIIKKVWTSSYVLLAGGWSALFLAAFYLVIDVWKVRAWSTPFLWIGTNALAIYVLCNVVDLKRLAQRLGGGDIAAWMNAHWAGSGGVWLALLYAALSVAICAFLYRRRIFIRL